MDGTTMLSLSDYARRAGKSERTVKRWLAQDALPGAVKVDGAWSIPADAQPLREAGGSRRVVVQAPMWDAAVEHAATPAAPSSALVGTPARGQLVEWREDTLDVARTLWDSLDDMPALVPVEDAARYLGVPASSVHALARRGLVDVVQVGGRHTSYVTQASIRALGGR